MWRGIECARSGASREFTTGAVHFHVAGDIAARPSFDDFHALGGLRILLPDSPNADRSPRNLPLIPSLPTTPGLNVAPELQIAEKVRANTGLTADRDVFPTAIPTETSRVSAHTRAADTTFTTGH